MTNEFAWKSYFIYMYCRDVEIVLFYSCSGTSTWPFSACPKNILLDLKSRLAYSLIPFFTLSIQGFSLASALGHSPKIVPDVREFAVQFGQFVRDDFRNPTLYRNAQ